MAPLSPATHPSPPPGACQIPTPPAIKGGTLAAEPGPGPGATVGRVPGRRAGSMPRVTTLRTFRRSATATGPRPHGRRRQVGCRRASSGSGRRPAPSPVAADRDAPRPVGSAGRRLARRVDGRRTPGRPGQCAGPRPGPGGPAEYSPNRGQTPSARPPRKGSRSSKSPSRPSACAANASAMSAGWNMPACQVAMWSSESAVEWSRA